MKTKTTSAKIANCNIVIFLTALYVTYIMVNHFVYNKPYPHVFIEVLCVLVATYASLKREQYKKV